MTEMIFQKLMRGEEFARGQVRLTVAEAAERGAGWTQEDSLILRPRLLRGSEYTARRAYRTNLNA